MFPPMEKYASGVRTKSLSISISSGNMDCQLLTRTLQPVRGKRARIQPHATCRWCFKTKPACVDGSQMDRSKPTTPHAQHGVRILALSTLRQWDSCNPLLPIYSSQRFPGASGSARPTPPYREYLLLYLVSCIERTGALPPKTGEIAPNRRFLDRWSPCSRDIRISSPFDLSVLHIYQISRKYGVKE